MPKTKHPKRAPKISAGDILESPRTVGGHEVFKHYGACIEAGENCKIIDTSMLTGTVETTLDDFTANGKYDVFVSANIKASDPGAAVRAAKKLVGRPYHLWKANCEHLAREVCGMKAESKQAQVLEAIISVAGVAGMCMLRANHPALKAAGGVMVFLTAALPEENPIRELIFDSLRRH